MQLRWGVESGEAWIAVLDEGPGIEPGEEERIFERFARGSTSGSRPHGTGLGLAIVAALARRWGGRATVANRPEGGALAEIRLPATPVDGLAGETTATEAAARR